MEYRPKNKNNDINIKVELLAGESLAEGKRIVWVVNTMEVLYMCV
jgi:hypothetical protein